MKITHNLLSNHNLISHIILLTLQKKISQRQIVVLEKVGKDYHREEKCSKMFHKNKKEHNHHLILSIQHQMTTHLVPRSLQ